MPKEKLENVLTKEELEDLEHKYDLGWFENFCGNCDNFKTENCPFREKALEDTKWKDLGCTSFWD